MADYTERAILEIVDKSSAQLRKINTELGRLGRTVASLSGKRAVLDTSSLVRAASVAKALTADLARMSGRTYRPRIDISSIAAATAAAMRLRAALSGLGGGVRVGAPAITARVTAPARIGAALPLLGPVADITGANLGASQILAMRRRLAASTAAIAKQAADAEIREQRRVSTEVARAAREADRDRRRLARESERAVRRAVDEEVRDRRRAASEADRAARRAVAEQRRTTREQERQARAIDAASVGARIGDAFRSTALGAAGEIGRRIAYGLARAGKEGYTAAEIGDARIRLLDLPPAVRAAAEQSAARISATSGVAISRGEALGLYAEALPITRGDAAAADELTRIMAEQSAILQTVGVSAKEANDKMLLVAKAAEQTGQVFDSSGKLDVTGLKAAFQNYTQAMIQGGREISPQEWFTFAKNANVAKYGLSDAGRLAAAVAIEQMGGARAGAGLNEYLRQSQGQSVPVRNLRELENDAFLTTKEIKSGSVGKKGRTSVVVDKSNLPKEAIENPILEIGQLLRDAMVRRGLDYRKDSDINAYVGRVYSTTRGRNFAFFAIKELDQIRSAVEAAQARNVSPEKLAADREKSGLLAASRAVKATETAAGATMQALNDAAMPVLNIYSGFANSLAGWVKPPGTEGGTLRGGVAVAGLAALAVGGKALIDAAGPLSGSAIALTGSAVALRGAAAALTGAAAKQALGGVGVVPAGAAGAIIPAGAAAAGATGLALAKRAAGGALAGAVVGAVEIALSDDKAAAIGGAIGAAFGGAIGSLAGPWGTLLGVSAGNAIGTALASTSLGNQIATAVANGVAKLSPNYVPEVKPFDQRTQEVVTAALAEVERIKREIAAIEETRKGGYLTPENEKKRSDLSFALKGATERLDTYTTGAIDLIAGAGNAGVEAITANSNSTVAMIRAAAAADKARAEALPIPRAKPDLTTDAPAYVPASQAEIDVIAYRAALIGAKTPAARAEAVRAVAETIATRNRPAVGANDNAVPVPVARAVGAEIGAGFAAMAPTALLDRVRGVQQQPVAVPTAVDFAAGPSPNVAEMVAAADGMQAAGQTIGEAAANLWSSGETMAAALVDAGARAGDNFVSRVQGLAVGLNLNVSGSGQAAAAESTGTTVPK